MQEIIKLLKRDNILDTTFNKNFPRRTIIRDVESEIIVMGAGWEFPFYITMFVATGVRKIIVYKITLEKFGAS